MICSPTSRTSATPRPPGEQYTAEEADTLGAEAQRQAEAIAGQVTQAAKRLGIELQEA